MSRDDPSTKDATKKPLDRGGSSYGGRWHVAVLAALVVLLAVRPSRAGDIDVRTRDGTPWTQLVAQIQDDLASRGRIFPVFVYDGSTQVHCGEYELRLDEVAAAAFQVEACDPTTDATNLRLAHREALFEPGDIVPRARKASISATITRRGHVEGGGAAPLAGSKLWCTVALQPYLWDGLRGEPTPLTPDRFVLRPIEANIHAAPDGAGWIARGESRFGLRFHYRVDDLLTGKKVLENEATLACADSPAGPVRAILLGGSPVGADEGPRVHIDSPVPAVLAKNEEKGWRVWQSRRFSWSELDHPICGSPCDSVITPGVYMIAGPYPKSAPFSLPDLRGDLTITVRPGSYGRRAAGFWAVIFGGAFTGLGPGLVVLGGDTNSAAGTALAVGEWVTAGLTVITGVVLMATSGTKIKLQAPGAAVIGGASPIRVEF